jgi:HSP20 family molecular chaperone IbpA
MTSEILLVADMPGVARENLSINLENNTLTIEGAFTAKFMGSCRSHEFYPADYHRVFTMPKGIDIENTTAEVRNGVLYLHLPKSAAVKSVRVAVNGG